MASLVPFPGIVDHLGILPRCDERVKVILGPKPGGWRPERFVLPLVSGPKEPVPARIGRGVGRERSEECRWQ